MHRWAVFLLFLFVLTAPVGALASGSRVVGSTFMLVKPNGAPMVFSGTFSAYNAKMTNDPNAPISYDYEALSKKIGGVSSKTWPFVYIAAGSFDDAFLYQYDGVKAPFQLWTWGSYDLSRKTMDYVPYVLLPLDLMQARVVTTPPHSIYLMIPLPPFENKISDILSLIRSSVGMASLSLGSGANEIAYKSSSYATGNSYAWVLRTNDGRIVCHFDFVKSPAGNVKVLTKINSKEINKYDSVLGPYCPIGQFTAADETIFDKLSQNNPNDPNSPFHAVQCNDVSTSLDSIPQSACVDYQFSIRHDPVKGDTVSAFRWGGTGTPVAMNIFTLPS